ncbi:MAG: thermonuclease family protein [Planctomycetota bacterium]|nr:MAG: thermonuclease family protein [Planctomycetota bacterium]
MIWTASPSAAQPATETIPEGVSEKAVSKRFHLKVVSVHDGDTITGLNANNEQVKIRLDAIDAPELKQPYGQAAKKALSDMVFGKDVLLYPKTKDRYGRTVGHVVVGKKDVNLALLEGGMAWHYTQYDKNKRMGQAEVEARAAHRGLWQDTQPVPPWDWRKNAKKK